MSEIKSYRTCIDKSNIYFRSNISLSLIGIIQVFTLTCITNFHVVNIFILFFLYLKDMNTFSIYLKNINN